VVYVWIKGAKNKKENNARLGRISLAYDSRYDVPELIYTMNF